MPPKSIPTLANLRIDAEGIRGSFEEFCCQVFRRAPDEGPENRRFRRIRGAGGDGGVEATWTFSDGKVWGLQAKFFEKLGANEKAQLTNQSGKLPLTTRSWNATQFAFRSTSRPRRAQRPGSQRAGSTKYSHPGSTSGRPS